jgi:endoglucanase
MNFNDLKNISSLFGTSGDESRVRDHIISQIKDYADYSVDNLGNLICHKKGKTPQKKIMLAAHMDEVGFIVTNVNSDGSLDFDMVGGINPDVVLGRTLYFPDHDLYGVVGTKPVHRLSAEERKKPVKFSDMYIDAGFDSDTDCPVLPGDTAYFAQTFQKFGGEKVCGKAIDDRAGCLMMIDLIKSDLDTDLWFLFSVQEEIGLRGAGAGSFAVQPDIALVLETTTAADIEGSEGGDRVCVLGEGAVILYKDRRTMYSRELYKKAVETAEKYGIKWQTKTRVAGGNDSGAIQTAGKGAEVLALSVPCRYLHSPSTVMQTSDYDAVYDLTLKLIGELS